MLSILFFFFLYYLCLPFVDSIYYYHFGSVSNSDALYPILFARDLLTGISFAKGWFFPPSHYLFPDVTYFLVFSSFEGFRLAFQGWVFLLLVSLFSIFRSSGLNFLSAILLPILFVRWAGQDPETAGQVLLPGFHGGMLVGLWALGNFLRYPKYLLSKRPKLSFAKIFFSAVIGFILFSDLWFLPTLYLPFLITFFIFFRNEIKRNLVLFILPIIISYLALFFLKSQGWHLFHYSGVPVQFHLPTEWMSWVMYSYSYSKTFGIADYTWALVPSLGLILFRLLMLLVSQWQRKDSEGESDPERAWEFFWLIIVLSQFGFLLVYGIPPKLRYLIPTLVAFSSLIFLWLRNYPWRGSLLPSLVVFLLVFDSYPDPFSKLEQQIQKARSQVESRMDCFEQISQKEKSIHLAGDYWATKYVQFFSQNKIKPLPYGEDFKYYRWIHNEFWNKDNLAANGKYSANSLLLREKEDFPELWKHLNVVESYLCGDWKWIVFKENFVF